MIKRHIRLLSKSLIWLTLTIALMASVTKAVVYPVATCKEYSQKPAQNLYELFLNSKLD